MFRKLVQKLNISNAKKFDIRMTDPFEKKYKQYDFLDEMTRKAVEMYEHKCDVKRFAELALSDPDDVSHIDIMNELFEQGVIDPYVDEKLDMLADNRKFLRDLGLVQSFNDLENNS